MSYLQNQMNVLKFDKRLLEINLKSGAITQDEYKQHLNTLSDSSANAVKLDLATEPEDSFSQVGNSSQNSEAPANDIPTNTDPFGSGF